MPAPGDRPKPATQGDRPVLLHRGPDPRAAVPSRPPQAQTHQQRSGRGHEPRPADAPRGTLWIYGMHAVAAALANPARRLRRLLLTEEAEAALATRLPKPWPLQPEITDRARLDQLLGRDVVHQGVGLLADPLAPPALAHALERPGPVLVLDQVTDPRNVGAMLRTAAAFGACAVITQDRNAPEETGALAKAASGALEKIPLFKAVNIARTLVALKAAGLWVVGLDASGSALSGPSLRERRVALVLGSEGEGLRRLTRDTCDEVVGLAMPKGHASEMESLNVSNAAAIALYELCRPA
jgi:23S rRNA (guanosine2251-2'-O)-methyltransferase